MSRRNNTRSLAEEAYDRLETLVVTLELKPGTVITEGELVARVGLGRTPVREAVQRLATQGLVNVLPRRGIFITPIQLSDHLALLETRRELERLIATRAARRANPEQRVALVEAATGMRKAADAGDMTAYLDLDRSCDELLAESSRNQYAAQAVGPMRAHCRRFWFAHKVGSDLPRFATLHAELMEAVASGDEGAAAAASDHLIDSLEALSRSTLAFV